MKRFLSALAIVFVGAAMSAAPVQAGPVLGITNVTDSSGFTVDTVYGYSFTALADLTATDLGIFDLNFLTGVIGDGLTEAHIVTLWRADGTTLAATVVPAGTVGTLIGGFRYMPIAPVALQSGQTYVVGAHYQSAVIGDAYAHSSFATYTWDPLIAPVNGRRFDGGLAFPTTDAGFFPGGPNVIVSAASAPEPGTLALLAAGLGGAAARRRRTTRSRTEQPSQA